MQIMRTVIRIEDSDFNEMQRYEEEYVNAKYHTMCDAYYNFSKSFNISVQNDIYVNHCMCIAIATSAK